MGPDAARLLSGLLSKGELAVISAALTTGSFIPCQHQDRDAALGKIEAARTASYGEAR